jgi:hypothetical protein
MWTAPQALLYLCFRDVSLACEARDDTTRLLKLRFYWHALGRARKTERNLRDAANLLLTKLREGQITATAVNNSASDVAIIRAAMDKVEDAFASFANAENSPSIGDCFTGAGVATFAFSEEEIAQIAGAMIDDRYFVSELSFADVCAKDSLSLSEALRVIASFDPDGGSDIASVFSGRFWAMADAVLPKFSSTSEDASNFIANALRVRERAASAIVSLLSSGRLTAATERGHVPSDAWSRWTPDWWRNELGPLLNPGLYRHIRVERQAVTMASRPTGKSEIAYKDELDRSGAPGRPTSIHLIHAEHERRLDAGFSLEKVSAESRYLEGWLASTHPKMPHAGAGAIENAIRLRHRDRKRP